MYKALKLKLSGISLKRTSMKASLIDTKSGKFD